MQLPWKKTTRFFCISHGNNVDVMSIKTQLSVSGGWTRLKMHNARCTQLRSKFRAVSTKLPKKCSLYKSCYTSNTVLQRYFPNGCVNAIMWTSDLGQKKFFLETYISSGVSGWSFSFAKWFLDHSRHSSFSNRHAIVREAKVSRDPSSIFHPTSEYSCDVNCNVNSCKQSLC